jgi:hypothetical protein
MCTHEQVWVKVNAPVDRGVGSLIRALSAFPQLQTLESCENLNGRAWVTFVYGLDWRELSEFVFAYLGPKFATALGDRVTLDIHVTSNALHRAEMAVRVPAIPAAVKLLTKLRAEFKT